MSSKLTDRQRELIREGVHKSLRKFVKELINNKIPVMNYDKFACRESEQIASAIIHVLDNDAARVEDAVAQMTVTKNEGPKVARNVMLELLGNVPE